MFGVTLDERSPPAYLSLRRVAHGIQSVVLNLASLKIVEQPDGVRLAIKSVTGASRDRIVGELGGALKVAVSAAPERGQANRAIIQLLAKFLAIRAARTATKGVPQ
ncbi:MAG: DUF167 domain-containing protein [Anaerolineae bacterium]|nr:DUF167 domain-containing protein [Phycisphaerae bacterium]